MMTHCVKLPSYVQNKTEMRPKGIYRLVISFFWISLLYMILSVLAEVL